MKQDINGKMETVSEFRGGGGGRSGGFSRPSGRGFSRPSGVSHPIGNHPAGRHPIGYRRRNYPRGFRRPFWGVGGGWLIWNGVYWIDPMGMCYFENDYGDYVPANCVVANAPIDKLQPDVLLFSGADGEKDTLTGTETKVVEATKSTDLLNNSESKFAIPPVVNLVAILAISATIIFLLTKVNK